MLSGISNSEWKMVKNLGQRLQFLFTGVEKNSNLVCSYAKSFDQNPYEPL
jgi:hypothetical protein